MIKYGLSSNLAIMDAQGKAGRFAKDSTTDLVLAAKAGGREAMEELFRRYLPRLQRWASGKLRGRARDLLVTHDLAQDAAVVAMQRLKSFEMRGTDALERYFRRVLRSLTIDQKRRAIRRPAQVELSAEEPGDRPSPYEELVGRETAERLRAGMEGLSAADREVLHCRLKTQCSHEEGARILGLPSADAFRMRLARATLRLAREMNRGR